MKNSSVLEQKKDKKDKNIKVDKKAEKDLKKGKSKLTLNNKTEVKLDSQKVRRREKRIERLKMGLLGIIIFLIIIYFLLRIIYETGNFTISLDPKFAQKSGLVMYEKKEEKLKKQILKAEKLEFMDNISVKWLPENLNEESEGSHNGDNYIAYTFYLENKGSDTINYWYQVVIDDVIKNVDKAIRVMIYRNNEKTIYAKPNTTTGNPEEGTVPFYSNEDVMVQGRKDFKPGDIDKFTIVIWIEGDDPDCIDELIGGEMKMHMDITEEHIKEKQEEKENS